MSHFYWLVSKCGSYQQTHCAMIMLYRRLSLVTRPWQRPSLNLSHCTTQDHWLGATITEIATTVSQCQSFIWDSRKLRSVFRALVNWPSFCLPLITLVHLCLVNLVISPSFACVLKFYLFSLSLLGLIKVTCLQPSFMWITYQWIYWILFIFIFVVFMCVHQHSIVTAIFILAV